MFGAQVAEMQTFGRALHPSLQPDQHSILSCLQLDMRLPRCLSSATAWRPRRTPLLMRGHTQQVMPSLAGPKKTGPAPRCMHVIWCIADASHLRGCASDAGSWRQI